LPSPIGASVAPPRIIDRHGDRPCLSSRVELVFERKDLLLRVAVKKVDVHPISLRQVRKIGIPCIILGVTKTTFQEKRIKE
jgi:hypothetical protein